MLRRTVSMFRLCGVTGNCIAQTLEPVLSEKCIIDEATCFVRLFQGDCRQPGGDKRDPPEACGVGEWDKVGGFAGEGAQGDVSVTRDGNSGAIRVFKPGYY